jgi:hypothetical protein
MLFVRAYIEKSNCSTWNIIKNILKVNEETTTVFNQQQPLFGNLAKMEIQHTVDYSRLQMMFIIVLAAWFGFSLVLRLISAAIYKRA